MSDAHIVSSFNEDMNRLRDLYLEMGRIVSSQLQGATRALRKEDRHQYNHKSRSGNRVY